MTTNRLSSLRFLFAAATLVVGVISQFLLKSNQVVAGWVFSLGAIALFVLASRKLPGPIVELNESSIIQKAARPQLKNIIRSISRLDYRLVYLNIVEGSRSFARSMKIWFSKNQILTGLFSFFIVLVGQFMISENQVLLGVVVTGLAALIFVSVFSKQSGSDSTSLSSPEVVQSVDPKRSPLRGIWLGTAILFAILAFWLFGTSIPPVVPWLLHLCSVGLFIYSSLNLNRTSSTKDRPPAWQKNKDGWTWLEFGIFLAILAIAAFLRTFRTRSNPLRALVR